MSGIALSFSSCFLSGHVDRALELLSPSCKISIYKDGCKVSDSLKDLYMSLSGLPHKPKSAGGGSPCNLESHHLAKPNRGMLFQEEIVTMSFPRARVTATCTVMNKQKITALFLQVFAEKTAPIPVAFNDGTFSDCDSSFGSPGSPRNGLTGLIKRRGFRAPDERGSGSDLGSIGSSPRDRSLSPEIGTAPTTTHTAASSSDDEKTVNALDFETFF